MGLSITKLECSLPSNLYKQDIRPNSFLLKNEKISYQQAGTINGFLQNEAEHQFFPMNEEKKTLLELKISGSGVNEGSLNFEVLTNKGLKLR